MIIKNKTNMFQKCDGKPVRPWRKIEVSDDAVIDTNKFEIIEKKEIKKKEIKKEKEDN